MPLTELDRKLLSELLAGKTGTWKVFVDRFTGLIIQIIQQTAHAHSLRLQQDDIEDLCADTYSELLSRDRRHSGLFAAGALLCNLSGCHRPSYRGTPP